MATSTKQRQARARDDHHRQRAEEHDAVAQRLRDRGSRCGLDLRRVRREAAHDLARVRALVEAGPEVGEVREHVGAQVRHRALADPVDEIEARRAGDGQHQAEHHQHGEVLPDHDAVVGAETMIDDTAHGHRHGEHGQRGDDEGGESGHKPARMPHDVRL